MSSRARAIAVIAGIAFPAFICAPASAAAPESLQAVLDGVVAEHQLVPGVSAYVDAPRAGLPWAGAAGEFAEGSGQPLSPDDPFRIASTMKPFTAAAILRLVEDGRLGLDDPVAPFLDPDQVARMHIFEGVNYGPRITIRQLLGHTSGLNGHDECNEYTLAVGTGPNRQWTAEEQIELMIDCGDPYFAPGTPGQWHYSDTGYVMLGTVLAKVTGKSLAGALRELLPLDALGMNQTWHELLEPERASTRPRAHQYVTAVDLTSWNPSFDSWGGGGYASTVHDLTRFIRGLFEGRVFRRPATLELMKTWMPVPKGVQGAGSDGYGLGVGHFQFDGIECWGHPGFWSVQMLYCPSLDLALATTTNQATDEHAEHTEGFVTTAAVPIVNAAPVLEPKLTVRPRQARRGRRVVLRTVFRAGERSIGGANVTVGRRGAITDADGRATLKLRFRRRGRRTARACKEGVGCATATIRVRRAPGRRRSNTG